jgi:hypothetical protein
MPPTPPPLWRRLRRAAPGLGPAWHPVHGAGPLSDPPPEPTAFGEVEIVEGAGAFRLRDVGDPGDSGFRYFLDGIEHTRICGYLGTVPLVHGYVAAVVREREERGFTTWDVIEREILVFPHRLLDPRPFVELGMPEDALIDSEAEPADAHPLRLAEKGREAVKLQRAICERTLARRWAENAPSEAYILLDGGLAIDPALLKSGRAIGLIKSHRTQFLSPGAMSEVLSMSRGCRSPVFKPVRPEVGEVYSWYLRLRPAQNHDIYWSLARIEARAATETVERADELSRWLLAETAPLALPDFRWDVLLYPIRDCEQFLRARMPTLDVW